ncbi:mechanosensitive ion channel [Arcanobacterium haemolyticum]|nr:mechanosensitive ion channel [Arcanobacterium haemolyticum]
MAPSALLGSRMSSILAAGETPTDSPSTDTTVEEVVSATVDTLAILIGVAVGLVVGVIVALVIQGFLTYVARRKPLIRTVVKAVGRPIKLVFAVAGAWIGMHIVWTVPSGDEAPSLRSNLEHAFLVLVIVAATWFVAALVDGVEKTALHRMQSSGASRYRKVQTQLQILHRILMVAIWVLGISLVLMTFPAARALGTTLFTSASLLSVVVGIAAQSTLGNVFAGLQLAFSDSIRMGDIVVWEKEFTTVEEITLTYVVLKVWDGRRLIVPSSQMTTKTFENWTRRTPDLLGYVDFDLDWKAPIGRMRAELNKILAKTDLWDGDTGILQVRDATANRLQVSVLLSAENASKLTDLKYYVREHLVRWIQESAPDAVPHSRALTGDDVDAGRFVRHDEDEPFEDGDDTSARAGDDEIVESAAPASPSPAMAPKKRKLWKGKRPKASSRQGDDVAVVGGLIVPAHVEEQLAETTVLDMSELGVDGPMRVPIEQRDEESEAPGQAPGHESSIFTGSVKAEKRGQEFAGPGEDVLREREDTLERRKAKEGEHAGADEPANSDDRGTTSTTVLHVKEEEKPDSTEATKTRGE